MDSVLNTIGLAFRASKVLFGELLLNNMKTVSLVFLASDASKKTQIRFQKKCYYYKIPCIMTYSSSDLSLAVGKNHIMAIGITDRGFSDSLITKIERRGINGKTST